MKTEVGIALYQLNALFKGFYRPFQNFNFIKGTLHNKQKKVQHMNRPTVPDCLDNSRCGSFFWCLCNSRFHQNISREKQGVFDSDIRF